MNIENDPEQLTTMIIRNKAMVYFKFANLICHAIPLFLLALDNINIDLNTTLTREGLTNVFKTSLLRTQKSNVTIFI